MSELHPPVTAEVHHTDLSGIEILLRTAPAADFYLVEEGGAGYSLHIVIRTAEPGGLARFVLDKARNKGLRVWRSADSAIAFIRGICPPHIKPDGVRVIFREGRAAFE